MVDILNSIKSVLDLRLLREVEPNGAHMGDCLCVVQGVLKGDLIPRSEKEKVLLA